MGQQQLLLLVLGVIVAGTAIVVGITLFQAYTVSANRDALIADLDHLAFRAMEYYRKPAQIGGGGNSFVGFSIPMVLASNPNGNFSITAAGTVSSITFRATGNEIGNNGTSPVTVQAVVTNSSVNITIIN
ncbi:MAG: hypothetical protein HUU54_10420 [Ignavibacteriaceae bacterium]|nr:hypothetical protein [Ignavibacteriaceae bacterium]